jgi:hypothetical protein
MTITPADLLQLLGWLGSVFGLVLYFERRLTRVEASHGDMQDIKKELKELRDVVLEHFKQKR